MKHDAVYDNPLYVQLCGDYAETDGILKFIEQCTSANNDIDSDAQFEVVYPMQDVGFLGICFNCISGIAPYRQIVDSVTLRNCRNFFLIKLIKMGDDRYLSKLLNSRFPNYTFSPDAQKDLIWWKHNDNGMVDTIISLLDDIPTNPFTGGLGKTEVLSNTTIAVASKRITLKDRLTYTFGATITIHRCKDHY